MAHLTKLAGFSNKVVMNLFRLIPNTLILGAFTFVAPFLPLQGAEAPSTFKVGEFSFSRPAAWDWIPTSSSMRKAELKINDAAHKETAEVAFFHFGEGGGGGTKANIDRWLSQFQEPRDKLQSKVEETTVNKRKITYVQAQGTYLSGMPGAAKTPQPNTMLLGAILESQQGNVFIRLTAPLQLAAASQAAFRKMVEGGSPN